MVFFWIGYVSISAYQFYGQSNKLADAEIASRKENLNYILQSSIGALVQEHSESLKDRLSQARKLGLIDFYILQKGDEVVFFENNSGDVNDLNHNYQRFNEFRESNGLTYKTIKVIDYRLTAGTASDRNSIIWKSFLVILPLLIKDIAMVSLMLGVICYLLLRDIMNLSKVLASRTRDGMEQIKTNSAEAETLLQASMGLEGERVRLENLSETYGETVGPAIRYELQSGRQAPYSFPATLCRVDLNGYTQMFLEKDDKYLTTILNQYFAKAREVIQRYDGLIYQFVGDEIVFLFKDEMAPDLSSESLAVACIRDLFYEATVIEQSLPPEANHYFKLKGSFAKGTMRFIQLDEGHAMSGLPLIESVRLLSLVDDKTHQVLTFFQEAAISADGLAFIFDRKTNQLKGFKEESLLCRTRDFNSIEWVFEAEMWDRLAYFRSDAHTAFVLKKVRLMAVTRRDDDIVRILHALKYHSFENTTPEMVAEAETTLNSFLRGEEEGLLSTKALSAVVTLIGRIIPQSLWTASLQSSIEILLEHKDPRVQANAIVVLGKYGYPARKIWENMFSQNNRVAADTIVEVAKQQLNADVWDALHRLLNSPHPSSQRSGEYALNTILNYYKETDPVYLKTNPILTKMQTFTSRKSA
ncbi:adenylate cyclase [Bdellovibrio sp. 22V]|uniref:adenylate cyclase n=1 Tax=Bdellovibrio sp. 22V TaxID=3044166 RepID=UPI002543BE52|nr:adenylate cyclase [Bdellovibrio sp. 22V]WII73876.1 adenylate cyclase [Bdellovibrio sp. 22V]